MNNRSLWDRLPGAYARRMAKWFGRRPFTLKTGRSIVTFTFDDFPGSALSIGGSLLEQVGARGTYFVARGLMGKTIETGKSFQADDLPLLLARGHELGCHTFHHHPAWETSTSLYESSIAENASALQEVLTGRTLQTHSYPISYPRPKTKRRLAHRFRGCRGGGQTFNHGTVDLNYLSSFFLEQSTGDFGSVERVIAQNAEQRGWLIFSTHDISDSPTRFGCSPGFFEKAVRCAVNSGARLLSMSSALDALGIPYIQGEKRATSPT